MNKTHKHCRMVFFQFFWRLQKMYCTEAWDVIYGTQSPDAVYTSNWKSMTHISSIHCSQWAFVKWVQFTWRNTSSRSLIGIFIFATNDVSFVFCVARKYFGWEKNTFDFIVFQLYEWMQSDVFGRRLLRMNHLLLFINAWF